MSLADSVEHAPSRPTHASRWRVFTVAWVLFSLIAIVWSLATPVSAAPDEPAHIVKAASVVRGQFVGEPSTFGHVVQVPRYIASTQSETCFAFHPQVPASCAQPLPGDPGEVVDSTTSAGLYNPAYYALVGWPTLLFDDATGIYAMRAVSGILTALFLAAALMMTTTLRRPLIPFAAIAIASPPMLLFLAGTVNPNAVETTATLAVFTAMAAIVTQSRDDLLAERCIILASAAAVAVNTRALSPLWLAVAVLVPLLLLHRGRLAELLRTTPVRWAIAATAAASAFAVAWILGANSLTAAIDDEQSFQQFPGEGSSPVTGFFIVIRDTFDFAQSMIGSFGWLDTPAPGVTFFVWAALTGTLLVVASTILRGRELAFAATLVAAFLLLPAVVQGVYITGGGLIWQGRYSLPLFAMLAVGVAIVVGERLEPLTVWMGRRIVLIVGIAWAVAQVASFASTLRRYAVGTDGTWRNAFFAPDWSAPGGNLVLVLAFGVLIVGTAAAGWWTAMRTSRSTLSP